MMEMRMVRAAAVVAGAVGGLSGAAYGLLSEQSRRARLLIGVPERSPLRADGVYFPDGRYLPDGRTPLCARDTDPRADALRFVVLGDSSAAGLGVDHPEQLPGVLLARGLAEETGRSVRLLTLAVSGVNTHGLPTQIDLALTDRPDVAIVMIGANDVRDRLPVRVSAAVLGGELRRLRATGVHVVVGTCPDFGMIRRIPQPLRTIARTWSTLLASAQRVAAEQAGALAVPLGDLLSPEFLARPADLFSQDGFHPNAAGYEAAAAVLLAPLCAAAGLWGPEPSPAQVRSATADRLRGLVRRVESWLDDLGHSDAPTDEGEAAAARAAS
ncbi:MAG TPA: SGNH/GDSL hydrolase family protein [Pseudonocardiaceae bacterium]|jgi:lysophospholipase L1-like esterase|nr:SGNH/GDSL hydrolase family protein [Pseudonocardiaceae bacterium]